MKINTDGVLLAALTIKNKAQNIIDIGTGTGVIALMIAQKFPQALITAVEIDIESSLLAQKNFSNSKFSHQIICVNAPFNEYLKLISNEYFDLIITNPPFFLNSLKSPSISKNLSKHAEIEFFENLFESSFLKLGFDGELKLIIPKEIEELLTNLALKYLLFISQKIQVHSYDGEDYIRVILTFSKLPKSLQIEKFVIYTEDKIYTQQYRNALSDYFINF